MNPSALAPSECAEALATNRDFRDAVSHDSGLYKVACRADFLKVSEDFLLREIARGKLVARRHRGSGGRVTYRIKPGDWARYLATCWPETTGHTGDAALRHHLESLPAKGDDNPR